MSIHIDIDFDALRRPNVFKAVVELFMQLGDCPSDLTSVISDMQVAPAAAPAAVEAPVAEAQVEKPAKQRKPRKPRTPSDTPKTASAIRAREIMMIADPAERWNAYLGELPEKSREFLDLLKEKKRLTIDEAVVALGYTSAKSMGGLTGAMNRWAPSYGVSLPFITTHDAQNRSIWEWREEI